MDDSDTPYDIESCIFELVGSGSKKSTKTCSKTNSIKTEIINRMELFGWNRLFLTKLFARFHYPMSYGRHTDAFIEDFIKSYILHMNLESVPILYDVFIQIGLRPDIAKRVLQICKPLLGESYTYSQIINIGVEFIVHKYKPIGSNVTTHIFEKDIINKWFTLDIVKKSYMCININHTISTSKMLYTRIQQCLELIPIHNHNPNTHDFHFHATSWSSSINIMNELNHAVGRPCLDFGIKSGFYISQTLNDALILGWKRSRFFHNEVAIVLFSIPKIIPNTCVYKHLIGEEWIHVTTKARMCEQRVLELPEILNCDLVFGNMVANPEDVKKGGVPLTHTPPKTQLVSKRIHGDLFLQDHCIGCIYFQKCVPSHTNTTRKNKNKHTLSHVSQ